MERGYGRGLKSDKDGNYYLSVPRWEPGIPATVNKLKVVEGKARPEHTLSWGCNEIGKPDALQSVLGWDIDENNIAWFLDQGISRANRELTEPKTGGWDITKNKLVGS